MYFIKFLTLWSPISGNKRKHTDATAVIFFLNTEFRRQLDARILFHTYTNCQQIEELTAKMCFFSSLLKPSFEKQTQRAWITWKLDLPLQDNQEVAYKQILRIFYIITHQNSQSLNFSIHTFFCTHIVSESAHKNSLNYFSGGGNRESLLGHRELTMSGGQRQ